MANINTEWKALTPDISVVKVSQDLNVYTAQQLRSELGEVIERARLAGRPVKILADLTDVEHLDSTGLGMLVGQLKSAREANCELELVIDNFQLKRIFEISGLNRIFMIRATVAEALAIADRLCMTRDTGEAK
jgi:anti-sigma B factor antagonist